MPDDSIVFTNASADLTEADGALGDFLVTSRVEWARLLLHEVIDAGESTDEYLRLLTHLMPPRDFTHAKYAHVEGASATI